VHGDDGLRAMCNVKHVSEGRMGPLRAIWYPYSARGENLARRLLPAVFSGESLLARLVGKF